MNGPSIVEMQDAAVLLAHRDDTEYVVTGYCYETAKGWASSTLFLRIPAVREAQPSFIVQVPHSAELEEIVAYWRALGRSEGLGRPFKPFPVRLAGLRLAWFPTEYRSQHDCRNYVLYADSVVLAEADVREVVG
jgi:hypothetical protein